MASHAVGLCDVISSDVKSCGNSAVIPPRELFGG
jgi:hypothetical protein